MKLFSQTAAKNHKRTSSGGVNVQTAGTGK